MASDTADVIARALGAADEAVVDAGYQRPLEDHRVRVGAQVSMRVLLDDLDETLKEWARRRWSTPDPSEVSFSSIEERISDLRKELG